MDDVLREVKADAEALGVHRLGVFGPVELAEDALYVFLPDADAIVGYGDYSFLVLYSDHNFDFSAWRRVMKAVFQEGLHDEFQARAVDIRESLFNGTGD